MNQPSPGTRGIPASIFCPKGPAPEVVPPKIFIFPVASPKSTLRWMTNAYLATMVRVACELAGGQGGSLFVVDGPVLRPLIVYNLPKEYIEGIGPVLVGTQCCGRAVEHKKPWIVTDMLTDPLFADGRAGAEASPIRAAFSVPVMDGEEAIASLACHYSQPHQPTELDIERNEVFAKLIAISIRGRNRVPVPETFFVFPDDVAVDLLGRGSRPAPSQGQPSTPDA